MIAAPPVAVVRVQATGSRWGTSCWFPALACGLGSSACDGPPPEARGAPWASASLTVSLPQRRRQRRRRPSGKKPGGPAATLPRAGVDAAPPPRGHRERRGVAAAAVARLGVGVTAGHDARRPLPKGGSAPPRANEPGRERARPPRLWRQGMGAPPARSVAPTPRATANYGRWGPDGSRPL